MHVLASWWILYMCSVACPLPPKSEGTSSLVLAQRQKLNQEIGDNPIPNKTGSHGRAGFVSHCFGFYAMSSVSVLSNFKSFMPYKLRYNPGPLWLIFGAKCFVNMSHCGLGVGAIVAIKDHLSPKHGVSTSTTTARDHDQLWPSPCPRLHKSQVTMACLSQCESLVAL